MSLFHLKRKIYTTNDREEREVLPPIEQAPVEQPPIEPAPVQAIDQVHSENAAGNQYLSAKFYFTICD